MSNYSRFITPTVLSMIFFPVLSFSAEKIVFHHANEHEIEAIIPLVLTNQKSASGLRPVRDQIDVIHSTQHIRLQQEYAGVRVLGGDVIIHRPIRTKKSSISTAGVVTGSVYSDLEKDLTSRPPYNQTEKNKILNLFKARLNYVFFREENIVPVIVIGANNQALWAYQVSALIQLPTGEIAKPSALINAKTHTLLMEWNDLKTQRTLVKGVGFSGNESIGKKQYGVNLPLLDIKRDTTTEQCFMENSIVRVIDLQNKYETPAEAIMFPCISSSVMGKNTYWTGYQANGYDEINGGFSVANDALYAGDVVKKLYKSYQVEVLKNGHKSMPLIMRVHYGVAYENAFWNGSSMTFGDGNKLAHPLVSVGIAAHEISHGFTEQNSDLQYYNQSGGINESFSDMASQAAEYYVNKTNTWEIGSEVLKASSGLAALRYMDKPSRDGRSIDRADQYRAHMDVHYSSGVYNRLFYLLVKRWGMEKAFQLMITANMHYWTPGINFKEGACGLIDAANYLQLPLRDLQDALNTVAINYVECV